MPPLLLATTTTSFGPAEPRQPTVSHDPFFVHIMFINFKFVQIKTVREDLARHRSCAETAVADGSSQLLGISGPPAPTLNLALERLRHLLHQCDDGNLQRCDRALPLAGRSIGSLCRGLDLLLGYPCRYHHAIASIRVDSHVNFGSLSRTLSSGLVVVKIMRLVMVGLPVNRYWWAEDDVRVIPNRSGVLLHVHLVEGHRLFQSGRRFG